MLGAIAATETADVATAALVDAVHLPCLLGARLVVLVVVAPVVAIVVDRAAVCRPRLSDPPQVLLFFVVGADMVAESVAPVSVPAEVEGKVVAATAGMTAADVSSAAADVAVAPPSPAPIVTPAATTATAATAIAAAAAAVISAKARGGRVAVSVAVAVAAAADTAAVNGSPAAGAMKTTAAGQGANT